MNELTTTTSKFDMSMTSREIAEVCGKKHKEVLRDIRVLISNKVIGQRNFAHTPYVEPQNNQTYYEFVLDQDATMTLVTGYDSHRRMAVMTRWRELEQGKATPAFQVPQSMSEALLLAGQLAAKNEKLEAKAAIDAPKVSFVEEVVEKSDGLMTLGNFGRVLKKQGLPTGAKKIFMQLRMLGIIMAGKPLPYDNHVQAGRFVISEKITEFRADPVTYVTGKGQTYVYDMLTELFRP